MPILERPRSSSLIGSGSLNRRRKRRVLSSSLSICSPPRLILVTAESFMNLSLIRASEREYPLVRERRLRARKYEIGAHEAAISFPPTPSSLNVYAYVECRERSLRVHARALCSRCRQQP